VDIVGCSEMAADAEVIAVAITCLEKLGMKNFKVRLNNRKILESISSAVSVDRGNSLNVFRAIDKLDKIGIEGVKLELGRIGLSEDQVSRIVEYISVSGSIDSVEDDVWDMLDERGRQGFKELAEIVEELEVYGFSNYVLDLSLARGLDYYTGPIFEVLAETKVKVGSVAGGGRYDNLIETIGGPPTPATGISLGVDRIVEVLEEAGMLPESKTSTQLLIAYVNPSVRAEAVKLANKLRGEGFRVEVDIMGRKLERQLKYADAKGIPYVLIVGPRELKLGVYRLRDMVNRLEREVKVEDIAEVLKKGIK